MLQSVATCCSKLFDWLVARINARLRLEAGSFAFIGVLDIFGFEAFQVPSGAHLHRDSAHPCHICARTKLHSFLVCIGTRLNPPATSASGLGLVRCESRIAMKG